MRAAAALSCLLVTACSQFPELDDVIAPDVASAPFPTLAPLEQVLDAATPVVADPIDTTQTIERRVEALRARARALQRRSIVDPQTRARIQERLG
ncbi:MAG: hypothetical protein AB3N17_12740 [Tateyamaria sp.]